MTVHLYEDDAESLHVYDVTTKQIYARLTWSTGATFKEAAAAIESGKTDDWRVAIYHENEVPLDAWGNLVAVFSGGVVTVYGQPGIAAISYLGADVLEGHPRRPAFP